MYYAIKDGVGGPSVERYWLHAGRKVTGYKGNSHRAFATFKEASDWLQKQEGSGCPVFDLHQDPHEQGQQAAQGPKKPGRGRGGKKYYVVAEGRVPGIYDNWDAAKAQVDGFSQNRYQSFPSRETAEAMWKLESCLKE